MLVEPIGYRVVYFAHGLFRIDNNQSAFFLLQLRHDMGDELFRQIVEQIIPQPDGSVKFRLFNQKIIIKLFHNKYYL